MSGYCEYCGSDDLRFPEVCSGYWRKTCAVCGSTGPFLPTPPASPVDVSALPHIQQRTDAQLRAGVEAFTLDGGGAMGVRIIADDSATTDGAALYDSVTGLAFGPVFNTREDAEQFLDFLEEEGEGDPRTMGADTLERLKVKFLRFASA